MSVGFLRWPSPLSGELLQLFFKKRCNNSPLNGSVLGYFVLAYPNPGHV